MPAVPSDGCAVSILWVNCCHDPRRRILTIALSGFEALVGLPVRSHGARRAEEVAAASSLRRPGEDPPEARRGGAEPHLGVSACESVQRLPGRVRDVGRLNLIPAW